MKRTLSLAILLSVTSSASALAAPERGNDELRRSCAADATTLCSGVDPDGKEMDACFKTHRKELSDACGRAVDAYQAKGGK